MTLESSYTTRMKISSRSIPELELRTEVRKKDELDKYCLDGIWVQVTTGTLGELNLTLCFGAVCLRLHHFAVRTTANLRSERAKPGQGPEFLRLSLCLELKNLEMALPLSLSPRNAVSLPWHQESWSLLSVHHEWYMLSRDTNSEDRAWFRMMCHYRVLGRAENMWRR